MEKRKDRHTLAAAAGICLLLVIGAVVLAVTLAPSSVAVFNTSSGDSSTASFTLHVLEGYTESPIADASVVILETGKTYKTDKDGMTENITVPVIRDTRYDSILEKPWGEVSLIVYKDGFVPYALFYLQVLGGQTREGVKILLFEQGSTDSEEPFSIIEGPNRAWVDQLVKMHQPQ